MALAKKPPKPKRRSSSRFRGTRSSAVRSAIKSYESLRAKQKYKRSKSKGRKTAQKKKSRKAGKPSKKVKIPKRIGKLSKSRKVAYRTRSGIRTVIISRRPIQQVRQSRANNTSSNNRTVTAKKKISKSRRYF